MRVWGKNEKSLLGARWRETWAEVRKREGEPPDKERMLTAWKQFFEAVSRSDFLMGKKTDWICNLRWLVRAANFNKVLNGEYHTGTRQDRVFAEVLHELREEDQREEAWI